MGRVLPSPSCAIDLAISAVRAIDCAMWSGIRWLDQSPGLARTVNASHHVGELGQQVRRPPDASLKLLGVTDRHSEVLLEGVIEPTRRDLLA